MVLGNAGKYRNPGPIQKEESPLCEGCKIGLHWWQCPKCKAANIYRKAEGLDECQHCYFRVTTIHQGYSYTIPYRLKI